MQMAMGGWVARAISEICKLNIPDTLQVNGPMTAAQLAAGLDVNTGALERVMRACASVGLFAEDAEGRFGPTPLSEVLTASAPGSVKMVAQKPVARGCGFLANSRRAFAPASRSLTVSSAWDGGIG